MGALDYIVDRDQHMRPLEYDLSERYNALLRYMQDMGVFDNVPVATLGPGETLSANDALAAPLQLLAVGGASTQTGTPTPDAPVPILSVDALEVHASADGGTTDYTNWPVSDLLHEGTSLRSLPDGTKDTLNLSYLRPSTREGWAWYSREVVTRITSTAMSTLTWSRLNNGVFQGKTLPNGALGVSGVHQVMCDAYQEIQTQTSSSYMVAQADMTIAMQSGYAYVFVNDSAYSDASSFVASLGDAYVLYPLATPTITTLDPIELPQLPAPTATVWCDGGSATPQITAEYIRNLSESISDMQTAIADIISG